MLSIENVGSWATMKHLPTGELHTGEVVDGGKNYAILQMDVSAILFIDNEFGFIDTRYDKNWKLEKVLWKQKTTSDQSLSNSESRSSVCPVQAM